MRERRHRAQIRPYLADCDAELLRLEAEQARERRYREALPMREADCFEASCLRSDVLEEQILGLAARGRKGLGVKFRELVYALRHDVSIEPWIDSLARDLESDEAPQSLIAGSH